MHLAPSRPKVADRLVGLCVPECSGPGRRVHHHGFREPDELRFARGLATVPSLPSPHGYPDPRRGQRGDRGRRTSWKSAGESDCMGLGLARTATPPASSPRGQAHLADVGQRVVATHRTRRGEKRSGRIPPLGGRAGTKRPPPLAACQTGRAEDRGQGPAEQYMGTVGGALPAGDGPGSPALPQPGHGRRGRDDAQLEPGRLPVAEPGDCGQLLPPAGAVDRGSTGRIGPAPLWPPRRASC